MKPVIGIAGNERTMIDGKPIGLHTHENFETQIQQASGLPLFYPWELLKMPPNMLPRLINYFWQGADATPQLLWRRGCIH